MSPSNQHFSTETIATSSIGRLEFHTGTIIVLRNEQQDWEVEDFEGEVLFANSTR